MDEKERRRLAFFFLFGEDLRKIKHQLMTYENKSIVCESVTPPLKRAIPWLLELFNQCFIFIEIHTMKALVISDQLDQALHCILHKDKEGFKAILQENPSLMDLSNDMIALPYMALNVKAYWAIDEMLEAGFDVATANGKGESLLMLLLPGGPFSAEPDRSEHLAVVNKILDQPGCNANQTSNYQGYALLMAFNGWPPEILEKIMVLTDLPTIYGALKKEDPDHNGFIFDLLSWGSEEDMSTCVNALDATQIMISERESDFNRLKVAPSMKSTILERFNALWLAKEEKMILEKCLEPSEDKASLSTPSVKTKKLPL